MPDNLAQRLADELTVRDIDLLRLAAGDSARFQAQIDALAEELVRRLVQNDPNAVGPIAGQARLEDIITASAAVIRDFYRDVYIETRRQLLAVMVDENNAVVQAVSRSMDAPLRITRTLVGESVERVTMRDIIDNRVITANANDAERLRGFFEREAGSHHKRFSGALRQAFSQDETITQMIARLKQVTEIVARDADAIIRTGYNHAVSQLRVETMQRNSVLFRGVIAVVMLDNRTSKVCMGRSRGQWDLNTGRPLPESPVQSKFPGPTPWHMNCRTQLYPLTRSARDIGEIGGSEVKDAVASLTPEQRRLLSPDPPGDETYTQWLKRQSAVTQAHVLGPTRRQLWLDGKIELQDLVTQKGRLLTLKQLQRRVAA